MFFVRVFLLSVILVQAVSSEELTEQQVEELISEHKISDFVAYEQLKHLESLDVIAFYALSEKFDTPLKIKIFKKTQAYAKLLENLRISLASLPDKNFTMEFDKIASYDLKKGTFGVKLDFTNNPTETFIERSKGFGDWETRDIKSDEGNPKSTAYYPNAIGGFLFPEFKAKSNKTLERDEHYDNDSPTFLWQLKVPEQEAVDIENVRESAKVVITYKIKQRRKQKVKYDKTNPLLKSLPKYHIIDFSFYECEILSIHFEDNEKKVLFELK